MTPQARHFGFADYQAVNALHRSVAWPERSEAGWRWFLSNPVVQRHPDRPAGWVVDDAGGVGAFLGNLLQQFWVRGQPRLAASGFSIIVSPRARGASQPLIRGFLDQPDLAAAFTLNANPLSAPILKRHGLQPLPGGLSDVKLAWIMDPFACLAGRANRVAQERLGPKRGRLSRWMHDREALLNSRVDRPVNWRLADGIAPLKDLSDGSDFAEFWRRLRAASGVIADRSPATMRWRLADPDVARTPVLLARRQGRAITAYLWAMLSKDSPAAPPMLDIIDVQTLPEDGQGTRLLVQALLDHARPLGAAKVRLQTVNPRLVASLGDLVGSARREGGWGHCLARIAPDLAAASWLPTPFDGDYSLCVRPAPMAGARQPQTVA
jgi:hypothetical protein